jgi:hypothetical protein
LWDAVFYCAAQLLGAVAGVALASLVLQGAPAHKAVCYAAAAPGIYGDTIALIAELAISFILMYAILFASGHEVLAPYTHYFARLVKEIMRRVRSTSTSRRGAGYRQSACLEETCRPRQGRVVDFACLDGFVRSDNGEDIQLELF